LFPYYVILKNALFQLTEITIWGNPSYFRLVNV